jgi:hypothetical protein
MTNKQINYSFTVLLIVDFLFLIYTADSLSISNRDTNIYYSENHNLLWYITHFFTFILGTSNIALRLPFIIFYILSILLAYLLTDDYFKKPIDRLISIGIFMLLPGLNSAALLIDNSIIVVFSILLYMYLYKLHEKEYYILLVVFLFMDNSFAILFLALFFYAIRKKDNILIVVTLILFGISMQMYGFDISGRPRGYFLDTFGTYATIFSPILFLYFIYTLYRIGIKGPRDLYWYIAFTSLILSLLFSLRQEIKIVDFAPFVMIAIPMMLKVFLHSYRVRLKAYRKNHLRMVQVILGILVLNFIVLLFNKPLYFILENPKKHFAYKFHIANDLANELKKNNILEVNTDDKYLQKQLEFYGIENSDKYLLKTSKQYRYHKRIDVKYYNKTLLSAYILLNN